MEGVSIQNTIIIAVVTLVVGMAIGWALFNTGTKKTDIKMKFGENELNINLEQEVMDASVMLTKLFSEDFSRKGTIDWLKKNQNLFQPQDPDLVEKLAAFDYNEIICKELREMSFRREGPWAYQLDTIMIGIPPEEFQPRKNSVNVCENGKYFSKTIKLFSLDLSQSIVVQASGKYECPRQLKFPDIQLNKKDAKRLLGNINFSKYEQGMALIMTQK